MNVALWILQLLLAFHTATGAMWKLSNAEATVGALSALPHVVWLLLVPLELACVVGLVLPAVPALRARFGKAPVVAAGVIVAEMLLYVTVAMASGQAQSGEITYWLVVAALAGFLAFGRARLAPHAPR